MDSCSGKIGVSDSMILINQRPPDWRSSSDCFQEVEIIVTRTKVHWNSYLKVWSLSEYWCLWYKLWNGTHRRIMIRIGKVDGKVVKVVLVNEGWGVGYKDHVLRPYGKCSDIQAGCSQVWASAEGAVSCPEDTVVAPKWVNTVQMAHWRRIHFCTVLTWPSIYFHRLEVLPRAIAEKGDIWVPKNTVCSQSQHTMRAEQKLPEKLLKSNPGA